MARPVVSQFKSPETRKIYDDAARFRKALGLDRRWVDRMSERIDYALRRNDFDAAYSIVQEAERVVKCLEMDDDLE